LACEKPHRLRHLSFSRLPLIHISIATSIGALAPLRPPILGGDRSLKSPRIGGFRGLNHWKQSASNLCISGSLLKERFNKTLIPLLEEERRGEVLPDQTKLQFST